jgi:hypothetical protein
MKHNKNQLVKGKNNEMKNPVPLILFHLSFWCWIENFLNFISFCVGVSVSAALGVDI